MGFVQTKIAKQGLIVLCLGLSSCSQVEQTQYQLTDLFDRVANQIVELSNGGNDDIATGSEQELTLNGNGLTNPSASNAGEMGLLIPDTVNTQIVTDKGNLLSLEEPDPDPAELLNAREFTVLSLLGDPIFVRKDINMQIWRYENSDCFLDIYLSQLLNNMRVEFIEARASDGLSEINPQKCFKQLAQTYWRSIKK